MTFAFAFGFKFNFNGFQMNRIIKTEGRYVKGDLIHIVNNNGKILGKGLSHYSNIEVNLVKGLKSEKIEKILGYRGKDEIIHKDDYVLLG